MNSIVPVENQGITNQPVDTYFYPRPLTYLSNLFRPNAIAPAPITLVQNPNSKSLLSEERQIDRIINHDIYESSDESDNYEIPELQKKASLDRFLSMSDTIEQIQKINDQNLLGSLSTAQAQGKVLRKRDQNLLSILKNESGELKSKLNAYKPRASADPEVLKKIIAEKAKARRKLIESYR